MKKFVNSEINNKYIDRRGFADMRNLSKKLSVITLCTLFATMQIANAADGLGNSNITGAQGGFVGRVDNGATTNLNFNGNAHVTWDQLNVGKGETLNYNAVGGANGLTVLNTVSSGVTHVYGNINANQGISKLIISNPNGMIYDGAHITAFGDVMLTTQPMTANFNGQKMTVGAVANSFATNGVDMKNTVVDLKNEGSFSIYAPMISVNGGSILNANNAKGGVKFVTENGKDFLATAVDNDNLKTYGAKLRTVNVDGNVYVIAGRDYTQISEGGNINGDLNITSHGIVDINHTNGADKLVVNGNLNAKTDGDIDHHTTSGYDAGNYMYLRDAKVAGNVDMSNSGGYVEVRDITVDGDAKLTTTAGANANLKHFVHVVGNTEVKGNLDIDSLHNIHIGGYDSSLSAFETGNLKVGKTLNANAHEGSVAVTVNTQADKVNLESGTHNILAQKDAVITANEYNFKADKYIGAIKNDNTLINVMESYTKLNPVSDDTFNNHPVTNNTENLKIAGGKITKLETPANAFIKSMGDLDVDGVKGGKIYITADQKDIKVLDNVHADVLKIGGETKNLTVNLPAGSRDYTLKYTDIKDTEVITINPNTTITYDMANGDNGWNKGTQTADNTYLVVAGPTPPPPTPPVPTEDNPRIQDNDNVKILNNLVPTQTDVNPQAYTPIAFAADLDDEIDTGVRKNVDGSVTVVRPFTPSK